MSKYLAQGKQKPRSREYRVLPDRLEGIKPAGVVSM